jgi:hypothetical protein
VTESPAVVDFTLPEPVVAKSLGISKGELRFLRKQHLKEDLDWKKTSAGVAFSRSGVKNLLSNIGRPEESHFIEDLLEKKGARPAGEKNLNGSTSMTISKLPPNPCVVLAVDDRQKLCTVWVGRNEKFVVGDKIEAEPHPKQPGFWRIVGPLPRDRRRIGDRSPRL